MKGKLNILEQLNKKKWQKKKKKKDVRWGVGEMSVKEWRECKNPGLFFSWFVKVLKFLLNLKEP